MGLLRPDGARLAVGTRTLDGADTIRVYEGTKEKPVAEIAGMCIPKAWVGRDALACGNGAEAGVYDIARKEWAGRVKGMSGEFAMSPDGTKLAATGTGLRVRLWDMSTGKQLHAENDSFPEPALLVGSADGRTLFILTSDTAYLWSVGASAAKPAGTLPGRAVAATVGGGKLVVATPDAVLVYASFDPSKPLPAKATTTFKDSAGAKAVAVSANGECVAWATDGGKVTVTDAAGKVIRRELPVTTTTILALGFNNTGDRLGTLGRDPFLRVWDVSAAAENVKEVWKARVQRGLKGAVAFSPDGKLLASAGAGKDNLVKVWDVKEQKELTQLKGHEQPVTAVVFADNEVIVTASMDRTIRTWTTKDAAKLDASISKEPKKDAKEPPKDKKDVKEVPKDKKDAKEPPKDKKDVKEPPKEVAPFKDPKELKKFGPTSDDPYAIAWSPATKTAAVCGYSGQITVWGLDADKPKFTKAIKSPGYCIAFTADGKAVLTGHDNGTVAVTPIAAK